MAFKISVESTTESYWNIIEWSNGTEWDWMVFNSNQWYTIVGCFKGHFCHFTKPSTLKQFYGNNKQVLLKSRQEELQVDLVVVYL